MGDLASDFMKEQRMTEHAITWVEDLIPQVLKAAGGPLDKYTIVDRIEAMNLPKVPKVWLWEGKRGRITLMERALRNLVGLKVVYAEPDDHTSIYSLINPLDSLARNA